MDSAEVKSLLVINDENTFAGVLSIGDIQRAIIRNLPLDTFVWYVLRDNPKIAEAETSVETVREEMLKHRMEFMPKIDANKQIVGIYLWEELFPTRNSPPIKQFNLPVVVMAGGFGKRLRPLTNVLPKPLIPIGDRTIIEEIFKRFSAHGCTKFYVSVNYKAEFIQYYLKELNLNYQLLFIKENRPLGTAGSLSLLKGIITETFFVSNCDIIIDQDYSEILEYHKENTNELTIVAALKHYPIPYGIVESRESGALTSILEKPEIVFKINSGMYLLEPELLDEIPENSFFHITELIKRVQDRGGKVGVFPVSEKSWSDIGDWSLYANANMSNNSLKQ